MVRYPYGLFTLQDLDTDSNTDSSCTQNGYIVLYRTFYTARSQIQIPILIANYRTGTRIGIRIGIRNCECKYRQECIPVGCVPAARWPYAGVCFRGGGVCLLLGGSAVGGGVCSQGGLLGGGVCSQGGCVVCSRGGLPQTRPLWTESQTRVKT